MISISWDVSELNAVAVDLGAAGYRATLGAAVVVRRTALDIVGDGQMFCPVDTGNLRAGIGADIAPLSAVIGPTADYGDYVENGTSVMAPQAFMGPALDRRTPDFVTAMEHLAERAVFG
jgi:HK97 gp10 family phage protein